ncbi:MULTISPECIES: hypothetical protein [Mesorhizobium]|uniref:Uncharacterized protein n=1 Tax=Mesorhizobium denitrificans TaxID=2294114 RepID=A0A371XGW6_9HYPH|nr:MULTISPECIES: hypothetical protein [Mesorhizobium]RFC68433.1 hypothetical protein DY251_05515 [Mesorhizobium denitrificans]
MGDVEVLPVWEKWNWVLWVIALSPAWSMFLWGFWQQSVLPRLIELGEIKAEADCLIAQYGSRAEEIAFLEEDRAWRYSQNFQQGKWHRVRKELWRRYDAGEWVGPEG